MTPIEVIEAIKELNKTLKMATKKSNRDFELESKVKTKIMQLLAFI